jgi:hypothetical protein
MDIKPDQFHYNNILFPMNRVKRLRFEFERGDEEVLLFDYLGQAFSVIKYARGICE